MKYKVGDKLIAKQGKGELTWEVVEIIKEGYVIRALGSDNLVKSSEIDVDSFFELYEDNSDAIKPDYYQFHGYDVFDIAEHFGLSFPLGNALKYLLRAGKKDSATWEQDLSKCKKCIERAMEMRRSE
jgi:hypothetical protein